MLNILDGPHHRQSWHKDLQSAAGAHMDKWGPGTLLGSTLPLVVDRMWEDAGDPCLEAAVQSQLVPDALELDLAGLSAGLQQHFHEDSPPPDWAPCSECSTELGDILRPPSPHQGPHTHLQLHQHCSKQQQQQLFDPAWGAITAAAVPDIAPTACPVAGALHYRHHQQQQQQLLMPVQVPVPAAPDSCHHQQQQQVVPELQWVPVPQQPLVVPISSSLASASAAVSSAAAAAAMIPLVFPQAPSTAQHTVDDTKQQQQPAATPPVASSSCWHWSVGVKQVRVGAATPHAPAVISAADAAASATSCSSCSFDPSAAAAPPKGPGSKQSCNAAAATVSSTGASRCALTAAAPAAAAAAAAPGGPATAAAPAAATAAAVAVANALLFSPPVRSRAAAVARYRAKRARRSSVQRVRYQRRKEYADKRPRVGGRFVKQTPSLQGGVHR